MNTIKIALDWTPNTNHTGFFVAQKLDFYKDNGLHVEIITSETDNYALTPAKKLELQQVDFAIAPTESLISLRTKQNKVNVKAIAALLQEDLSAIVTLKSSNINFPGQLDGKIYASYQARYEDEIVRKMIVNDGGAGKLNVIYPEKLGIWDTLLENKADATWIFLNWEGVEAAGKNVELNVFKLSDYAIPYSYSPVILALEEAILQKKQIYQSFLQATKQGFLYAKSNPEESVHILTDFVPEKDKKNIDILKSQLLTSASYGDEFSWGKIETSVVQKFVDWLYDNKLENAKIDVSDLIWHY